MRNFQEEGGGKGAFLLTLVLIELEKVICSFRKLSSILGGFMIKQNAKNDIHNDTVEKRMSCLYQEERQNFPYEIHVLIYSLILMLA